VCGRARDRALRELNESQRLCRVDSETAGPSTGRAGGFHTQKNGPWERPSWPAFLSWEGSSYGPFESPRRPWGLAPRLAVALLRCPTCCLIRMYTTQAARKSKRQIQGFSIGASRCGVRGSRFSGPLNLARRCEVAFCSLSLRRLGAFRHRRELDEFGGILAITPRKEERLR